MALIFISEKKTNVDNRFVKVELTECKSQVRNNFEQNIAFKSANSDRLNR